MKRKSILIAVLMICAFAYWGAQHGSYQANYYWAKKAEKRKEMQDAELKKRQEEDAAQLLSTIARGLDRQSKERWDKYDQCLRLGGVKAGQPDANELVLKVSMPTWMQYCLTGTVSNLQNDASTTSEPR
jgi:hypothetical protein